MSPIEKKDAMLTGYFHRIAQREYVENIEVIRKMLQGIHGRSLLDIGCHDGSFVTEIGALCRATDIHGIDIDPTLVLKARSRGISAEIHDANQLFPFSDNAFDIIISNQVMEHIVNVDNFFREVYRILKPGGHAIISTPNMSSTHNIAFIVLGMQPPGINVVDVQLGNFLRGTKAEGHIRLYNVSIIKDFAAYYGFVLEQLVGSGLYLMPSLLSRWWNRLTPRYAIYLTFKITKQAP